jgi:hypothetical protein
MRFNDATFGLKATDSVDPVLVSPVEVLVTKAESRGRGGAVVVRHEEEGEQLLAGAP